MQTAPGAARPTAGAAMAAGGAGPGSRTAAAGRTGPTLPPRQPTRPPALLRCERTKPTALRRIRASSGPPRPARPAAESLATPTIKTAPLHGRPVARNAIAAAAAFGPIHFCVPVRYSRRRRDSESVWGLAGSRHVRLCRHCGHVHLLPDRSDSLVRTTWAARRAGPSRAVAPLATVTAEPQAWPVNGGGRCFRIEGAHTLRPV